MSREEQCRALAEDVLRGYRLPPQARAQEITYLTRHIQLAILACLKTLDLEPEP